MKYEIRKLSFGKTWEEALNLYLNNFVPLFLIALVSVLPLLLIPQPSPAGNADIPMGSTVLDAFLWFFALLALGTFSAALLIEFIFKKYLKQEQTMEKYIQGVLSFISPIIGLSILVAIAVGVGFMALFVPGIYLTLALSLAVEVLIIERKGVIESMKRSFFLTRGKKMEIFLFTVFLALISIGLEKALDLIFSIVDKTQMAIDIKIFTLLFTQALAAPLGACVFVLVYFNIRIEKEGFDLEHMIEQFSSPSPQE